MPPLVKLNCQLPLSWSTDFPEKIKDGKKPSKDLKKKLSQLLEIVFWHLPSFLILVPSISNSDNNYGNKLGYQIFLPRRSPLLKV